MILQIISGLYAHHLGGVHAQLHLDQIGIQQRFPLDGGKGNHHHPLIGLEIGGAHIFIAPGGQKLQRRLPAFFHALFLGIIGGIGKHPQHFSALPGYGRFQRAILQLHLDPIAGDIAPGIRPRG